MTTCPICQQPRDGTRLWCGGEACGRKLEAMSTAELNALRLQEVIAAFRRAPDATYIHTRDRQ